MASGLAFSVEGFGCRVEGGFGFRVEGFGFRIHDLRIRVGVYHGRTDSAGLGRASVAGYASAFS